MIKVCDAIMGSGKSESAISYMNEHSDKKFIYVTPYLSEAKRIQLACSSIDIIEPEETYSYDRSGIHDREDDEGWRMFDVARVVKQSKVQHTAKLISEGKNVATTHQAFLYYTEDMLREIHEHHYTLIIDEDMQVLQQFKINPNDLNFALSGGLVEKDGDVFTLAADGYKDGYYYGMTRLLRSRILEQVYFNKNENTMLFWVLPPKLLVAFDDVFILTYLFRGQALYHVLEMNNMPYEYIGIRHDDNGYHFDPNGTYIPGYVRDLRNKIHIESSSTLNAIGRQRNALSVSWMKSAGSQMDTDTYESSTRKISKRDQLKNNIYNYFTNIAPGDSSQRMWTTYKAQLANLKGKNYTKRFVVLNKKATNDYAKANSLVYAANIFMHPAYRAYYSKHGVDACEDLYALSTMIQWIWRSAIRNGEEIWIYIPSRRMRELLQGWLDSLVVEGDTTTSIEEGRCMA